MWREILLGLIAALLVPTLILVWRTFRVVVIFQQFPPHLHVGEDIQYPVGMEPGRRQKLEDRHRSASASP